VLKVKLAMAIIGISSIHLLKTIIEAGSLGALPLCSSVAPNVACSNVAQEGVMWLGYPHVLHSIRNWYFAY